MIQSLTCGIVIYDEIKEIQNLIPKIKLELKDFDVEWIFVLNHEQSEIRKWISDWIKANIPSALCHENPSNNLGFARQIILEKASHEYIYLTDPDIDILSGNLKKLIQLANVEITNEPDLKFLGYGGTVTHKSTNSLLQNTFDLMSKISKLIPFSFQIQNHAFLMAVDHLPSCHLLLNKNLALRIGGFSSAFSKYGEDLDFTHRAYTHNYRFVFLPSAQVIHWQNFSTLRWIQKMFQHGRIQIPVQRINWKGGLRYYRLIPLLTLLAVTVYSILNIYFLLFGLALVTLLGLFNTGIIGFFVTYLAYSFGELFELVVPLFEYRNAEELQAINKDLKHQLGEAKNHN